MAAVDKAAVDRLCIYITLYNAHGLTKYTTKTVFGVPASCMPRSIVGFTDEVIEEK